MRNTRKNQYIDITMNNRTGLVFDNRFFAHAIDRHSPENPDRVRKIYQQLAGDRYAGKFKTVKPRELSNNEMHYVHSSLYIKQLREHSVSENPYSYDRDTYLMQESLNTAQLASGGCFQLVDEIMAEKLDNGFALIRPPGHHAEEGRGMGFCILNNVALTAKYLQQKYGLNRILIVDFDAHHGNGTQDVFYDSDKVMVISLHQKGLFPFSGEPYEIGKEKGKGYTINVPVFSQFGDVEYTFLMGRLLQSIVEQYLPQFILVSAGYDAHIDDTISATMLSTSWYGTVTSMLKQYAAESCDGKLLYVLEGGYNPIALEESVLTSVDALLSSNGTRVGVMHSSRAEKLLVDHPMKEFWTI